MLKINLGIVKRFINDTKSFAIEARITLGLNSRLNMDESENKDESTVFLQQQTEDNVTLSLTPNAVVNLPENTTDKQRMPIQAT